MGKGYGGMGMGMGGALRAKESERDLLRISRES